MYNLAYFTLPPHNNALWDEPFCPLTARDLSALQEKQTETLAQALSDAAAVFRIELRDVQEQQQAAEEELKFAVEQSSQQIQVQCGRR